MEPKRQRDGWLAAALGIAIAATFVAMGRLLHPMLSTDGEADNYVGRAVAMAAGQPAGDPFHPYGVSLLMWLGVECGFDAFAVGRAISAVGAGLMVAGCYLLLRTWTGRAPALIASLAVATADIVLIQGQLASSDMLAAGLMTLCLLAWVRAAPSARDRLWTCGLGGLCLGLAIACRHAAGFYVFGVLPLLLCRPWWRGARRGLMAAAGIAVGVLPDLWAQMHWGSGIDRGGNLACIVLKYHYHYDFEVMRQLTRAQVLGDLAAAWPDYLWRGVQDVGELFSSGLSRALVSSRSGVVAVVLTVACTVALLLGLFGRDRGKRVLACAGIAYGCLLALTYTASGRFLLPLLPVIVPLLLAALAALPRAALTTTIGAAMLLLFTVTAAPAALARFGRAHPTQEAAWAAELVAAAHRPLVILADFWQIDELHGCWIDSTLMNWKDSADEGVWSRLARLVRRRGADLVMLSRDRSPRLVERLLATPPPAGYSLVPQEHLLLIRCDLGTGAQAWPAQARHDAAGYQLEFTPGDLPEGAIIVSAAFLACDPGGAWIAVGASREADGRFAVHLPAALRMAPGTWRFHPALFMQPGGLLRGQPIELAIAAR